MNSNDVNGYKKIFRSASLRAAILKMLRFIPDKLMLKIQYRIKMGKPLNINKPVRFTEKLQWYKMYYKNPIMHECVDKYSVRQYVQSKGLGNILVKLYERCESIEDIKWENLPQQFVIKTTNGGGGLNVVICNEKSKLDIVELKKKLKCNVYKPRTGGREWAYYGLQPGIVVEELLINEINPKAGINDYKFFCYNGKVKYIIVDVDRYIGHKRNFYDVGWNNLHITSDCPAADRDIEKPNNLEEMINVAEILSQEFPYVRVDLYSCNGKVYFGELTFYPWSGYVKFSPEEADKLFGEEFELIRFK